MDLLSRDTATICAPITAPGFAGVAVLRVSGAKALEYARPLAPFLPEKIETNRTYYGFLKNPRTGEDIDEVLITFFEAGRSFTGEETIEISCHGSMAIQREIMAQLTAQGCLPAQNGEFTFRAFSNGRIDLVQAESVLTLINAQTDRAAKIALRQLKGGLSKEISEIENGLTWILANIEAGIDFTTEDIDVVNKIEIEKRSAQIHQRVSHLVSSYRKTRPAMEGIRVVFQGRPNSGKSSLLNALLQEDRAIVTEIPGTTRDIVEGDLWLPEGRVQLVDTAGLRPTEDRVEQLGVRAAVQARQDADIILYLIDSSELGPQDEDLQHLEELKNQNVVVVFTKNELPRRVLPEKIVSANSISLSVMKPETLSELKRIFALKLEEAYSDSGAVVIQERHVQLLTRAAERMDEALKLLHADASLEFVAFELQEALLAVYELLGKRFDDQVMDRVFREFCIGK